LKNLGYAELASELGISLSPELSQLLELAFTHRSYAYEAGGVPTNERLEFLGDAVLGLVVTQELYRRFPELDESRLSPIRSAIVNTKSLATLGRAVSLGQYMQIGRGEESSGGREKNSILADALEAVLGAIYLACGFESSAEVILRLVEPLLGSAATEAIHDAKTSLQEFAAANGLGALEYRLSESGPDHAKRFTAQALLAGQLYPPAQGQSKREAEQAAARLALTDLAELAKQAKPAAEPPRKQ
jgi:ribonuclease-3